jgi:hypothetical protein
MEKFFTRERFGKPQVLAAFLLLIFLGQCIWLVIRGSGPNQADATELFRVEEGLRQWRGQSIAGTPALERMEAAASVPQYIEQNDGYDPNHSPLWYLLASLPLLPWSAEHVSYVPFWGWLGQTPYLIFGLLLGASLWYVTRRLYGNAGGYIALTLYCFSPLIIQSSTLWLPHPEIAAAWGTFGAIFTAIAVAHTLYAPREVVLWNWRRILLLGLSLALAIGSQFSLIILVPAALVLMLYVAPTRRLAACAIWAASCVLACVLLWAAYGLDVHAFAQGFRHANMWTVTWQAFVVPNVYFRVFFEISRGGPAFVIALLPIALAVYVGWRRSRYFGNTAPLLIAGLFVVFAVGTPHYPGLGFALMSVPFLFVFVAGIAADLLETRQRPVIAAAIWGLLLADAVWHLIALARVGSA